MSCYHTTNSLKNLPLPRLGPITVNAWSDQALTVIGPDLGTVNLSEVVEVNMTTRRAE